jgi:hypothetical protein
VNVAKNPTRRLPRSLPTRPPSPTKGRHWSRSQVKPDMSRLSRTDLHESPVTSHKSRLFMHLPALQLSCSSFSRPRPLFSIVCGLFYENTGGGIPLPDSHGSQATNYKARFCHDFHPLPVTSLQSRLGKSFRMRSYRNPVCNSFRIRSYKNTPGVAPPHLDSSVAAWRIRQPQTTQRLLGSPLWCEN